MCLQICQSALSCWSSRCQYEPFRRCWPTPRTRLRGWVWKDTHVTCTWMYSRLFSDQGFPQVRLAGWDTNLVTTQRRRWLTRKQRERVCLLICSCLAKVIYTLPYVRWLLAGTNATVQSSEKEAADHFPTSIRFHYTVSMLRFQTVPQQWYHLLVWSALCSCCPLIMQMWFCLTVISYLSSQTRRTLSVLLYMWYKWLYLSIFYIKTISGMIFAAVILVFILHVSWMYM